MSYESPIEMFTDTVGHYWSEQNDELVMKAVKKVGVEVNKDELVKALAYDRDQYEKGFHDGMMANKWIPTSERLPDDGQRVNFCFVFDGCTIIEIGFWNADRMFFSWGGEYTFELQHVTAWMPLPEPYEE